MWHARFAAADAARRGTLRHDILPFLCLFCNLPARHPRRHATASGVRVSGHLGASPVSNNATTKAPRVLVLHATWAHARNVFFQLWLSDNA